VLKDFLAFRPVFHYTEKRVRGHVAICVLAAVIEAVMALDLVGAKITDPDLEGQQLTARRALRELERIRMIRFSDADGNERQVITRPGPFQAKILASLGVDTSAWRSRVA
jgi:transposase